MSIHGLPGTTPTSPQDGGLALPSTAPLPKGNGLAEIQESVGLTPPAVLETPEPDHPAIGLQQVQGDAAGHKLGTLSGKSNAITAALKHGLSEQLDERLDQMPPAEREQVKSLLHFAWYARGDTTADSRLQIRTILAACIAQGMDLNQAAALKALLSTTPAVTLNDIATELLQPNAKPFGVLSDMLLDVQQPDRARFEVVRNLVQSFPPDVARAGQTEHVSEAMTLHRDDQGRLQCAHASAGFVRIGGAAPYPVLTAEQRQQVRDAFTTDCAPRYGRMGVALDMMGAFAAENLRRSSAQPQEAPISLSDFKKTWTADGAAAMARYGKGDCMTSADAVVKRLRGQGITAHLAGVTNFALMQQRHGRNGIPGDGLLHTMGITHIDVLVPYRTQNGEERVMLITPGMGNLEPEKYLRDLPANDPALEKCRVGVTQELDASTIQKAQLGFLTNLLINDRAWDAKEHRIVGIDLVQGTIGLNGAATARFREAHGGDFAPEETSLSFNYRDALAHPGDLVEINIWQGEGRVDLIQEMTKLESLTLFLRTVQEQFAQPPDFVANTLALLSNEAQYHSDVLWPTTRALNNL